MNVTVGNLVNGGFGQATTLTTIVSIDQLYSYINVPESTALRYQKLALQEKNSNVAGAKIGCFLQLENETNFPHQGVIDFVDNQVDVNTGTEQIRCVFANPTTILTPGLYALTRIPASGRYQTLLIPDAAVNADQNERYLLIVGTNDVVQQRPVKLGALFGTLRSITDGLKPGERVIVNGMQSAQSGAKVIPHEVAVPTQSLDALESITALGPGSHRHPTSGPLLSSIRNLPRRCASEDRAFFSSGLRHRPCDSRDNRWFDRGVHAANRSIPADRAANRYHQRYLSWRQLRNRREDCRHADRRTDQWRGEHALHVQPVDQHRESEADGDFQGWHQPRRGPGAGPEPGS
jgi:hypothetical protein